MIDEGRRDPAHHISSQWHYGTLFPICFPSLQTQHLDRGRGRARGIDRGRARGRGRGIDRGRARGIDRGIDRGRATMLHYFHNVFFLQPPAPTIEFIFIEDKNKFDFEVLHGIVT